MDIPYPDYTGHLPPYLIHPRWSENMSPYSTNLFEIVKRFGYTKHRRNILKLFIQFRKELYNNGISKGFQWVCGSFITEKEATIRENPIDIDVVTFYSVDKKTNEKMKGDYSNNKPDHFLNFKYTKKIWKTDAHYVNLDGEKNESESKVETSRCVIKLASFWFGLFGHTRDDHPVCNYHHWKGMLLIDLNQVGDDLALKEIERRERDEEANEERNT